MKTLLLSVALFAASPAFAQMGIEVTPGVTFYGGPNGGTVGVEITPGVRHFSGEVSGSAIEIMPGVTSYNLQPSYDEDRFSRDNSLEQLSRDTQQNRARLAEEHTRWMERH